MMNIQRDSLRADCFAEMRMAQTAGAQSPAGIPSSNPSKRRTSTARREGGIRRSTIRMSTQHRRGKTVPVSASSSSGARGPHAKLEKDAGQRGGANSQVVQAGLNPLYGSNITTSTKMESNDDPTTTTNKDQASATHPRSADRVMSAAAGTSSSGIGSYRAKSTGRGGSPQSTITTSTTQSSTSSRHARRSAQSSKNGSRVSGTGGGKTKGNAAAVNGKEASEAGSRPAPLVPAVLAPVPPPPRKRKVVRSNRDIETGEEAEDVVEEAPNKTFMEMIQAYLKTQDLYTRIVLMVLLLVLAGGVFGAYVVLIYTAIEDKKITYIVLCVVVSLLLLWVIWKYCFSGDEKLQDQSQIAQDIATLYAAIPDHTAPRGVSEKGRAQFTVFKYEKSEMMFTAVTDDGVSLGSERGSELMMDGADPACPLCNVAYIEGADLCLLPCLHVFHKSCIHKWCNRHIVCPLCKRHLEAPEPIHHLTAANYPASRVQSEPGRHHGAAARGNGTWKSMLGAQSAGPASGHGSERGLGGTRSDDGLWNDRVLNAAQRQQVGRGHNRVTSFSSETRRANSARGRSGTAGRGGPPQTGSSGSGAANAGKRSTSVGRGVHGTGSHGERGYGRDRSSYQRQRSSSFTTTQSERPRGGSGRVWHGTKAERGSSAPRLGEPGSPRSRSDLGLGSKDADRLRATSDAVLSRHAMRHAGSRMKPIHKMFGEDGAGAWAAMSGAGSGAEAGSDAEKPKRSTTVVTVSSKTSSKKGVHSQGQGPTVITVRKVKPGAAGSASKASRIGSGRGKKASTKDFPQSADSDLDGSRRGETKKNGDDVSSPESTTKALSYGPRKPRVASKTPPDQKSKGGGKSTPGHRRVSSTGSNTSADESGSVRKPRRRFMQTSSTTDGGSDNYAAAATAAATAEAAARLLQRPKSRGKTSKIGVRSATEGVSGNSSGGDSSSDGRSRSIVRRRTSKSSSTSALGTPGSGKAAHRRNSAPGGPKATPPKTGPVTKGTPAPPMAAARAAAWNTVAPAPPVIDQSASSELDPTSQQQLSGSSQESLSREEVPATSAQEESSAPNSPRRLSGRGRGRTVRIPSINSAEFFGFGSNNTGSTATPAEGDTSGSGTRGRGFSSRVFRSSGSSRSGSNRLFGPGSAAKIGIGKQNSAGFVTDSEDERVGKEQLSEETRRAIAVRSGSVQELIRTYEKPRSLSDEKYASDVGPSKTTTIFGSNSKRNGKNFRKTKRGSKSITSITDLLRAESEQDDERINRPKLTYKKPKDKDKDKENGHSRQTSAEDSIPVGVAIPDVNPDGEDWGEEDPYVRPKLSYGGLLGKRGTAIDRRPSLVFDSKSTVGGPHIPSNRRAST